MAVTITATTVGVRTPALVQVAVEGLTVGASVRVVQVLGSGVSLVRGGQLAASSSQVILLDDLAPLGRPVTYRVEVGGVTAATSGPVTVAYPLEEILTSLTGDVVVDPAAWQDNSLPVDIAIDQRLTYVPGRRNPVMRYAMSGSRSGAWQVRLTRSASAALEGMLAEGAPLLVRTTGLSRDLPAAQVVAITKATSVLWGEGGVSTDRVWDLSWVALDDPLADEAVPGDTFADVDAGYAGSTFADLDAAYAGSTFADFNRADWSGRRV